MAARDRVSLRGWVAHEGSVEVIGSVLPSARGFFPADLLAGESANYPKNREAPAAELAWSGR